MSYTYTPPVVSDYDGDQIRQHESRLSRNSNARERLSRNSTGAKEEFIAPRDDELAEDAVKGPKKDGKELLIAFVSMVFVGLGNKVFNKLMTIPMHNYPNFLNLLTTFVYIPVCFAYIIPATRSGYIPQAQTEMSKRPFAVMGTLDAMAGIMQVFAVTYLTGPLVILLSQAAIPVSMIISRYLLKAKYNSFQYAGALILAGGIITVLAPTLSGGGNALWAIVMILSTIPMALSSVYKEIALGEQDVDPIYLNGWIAVFQFFFSIVLCVPSSLVSDPPVPIKDLPDNMWAGLKCYVGISTVTCDNDSNCTADKCNPNAPMFVTLYLFFNQLYNLLIILILKYGSANLLFMALTLMVPLGNIAFTLPFIPESQPLRITDILGLIIICLGLGCYRFAYDFYKKYFQKETLGEDAKYFDDDNKHGLERVKESLLLNDEENSRSM